MQCFDSREAPVPKDRVVMVCDVYETSPNWEFGLWADGAFYDAELGVVCGGWCIGSQDLLRFADKFDEVGSMTDTGIIHPTHWMELPAVPSAHKGDTTIDSPAVALA